MKWRCKLCGSVQESQPDETHTMNSCKCKKTKVDLEEHYMRIIGDSNFEKIHEPCTKCQHLDPETNRCPVQRLTLGEPERAFSGCASFKEVK